MRKYLLNLLLPLLAFSLSGTYVSAQTKTFTDANAEYTFEIPSDAWKIVAKPSALNPNVEMVYIDRQDGYLEIKKSVGSEEEQLTDFITREQDQRLQFQPGYVAGKDEAFAGNLKGKVFNYEFVRSGPEYERSHLFSQIRAENNLSSSLYRPARQAARDQKRDRSDRPHFPG